VTRAAAPGPVAAPAPASVPAAAPPSALAAPSTPAAAPELDKLAPELVPVATETGQSAQPTVRVLVYGPDALGALQRVGAQNVEHVDLIEAESGLIASDRLEQLAKDAGVTYVQIDSPVEQTDSAPATTTAAAAPSSAALTTLYP